MFILCLPFPSISLYFLLCRLLECLFVLTRTTLSGGISTKQTASFSTFNSAKTGGNMGSDYLSNPPHPHSCTATSGGSTEPTNTVNSVIEKVLQTEQDAEETRVEVMQLFRSRATQLLHCFVLLLHTVVAQLWQVVRSGQGGAETTQAVLEVMYLIILMFIRLFMDSSCLER